MKRLNKTRQVRVPLRYLPTRLTKKDRKRQIQMLLKSRKSYKKHQYYNREKVSSYNHKVSSHILDARKIYHIDNIRPSKELSKVTGCSISALKQIVKKGEGAYYSSGSRPNQSAQSWGLARLASSITSGKAAAVDYSIIEKGCDHSKKAFRLATKSKKMYNHGQSRTKKVFI